MPSKKNHKLRDGKKGAALAIRVTPRAAKNQVAEVMRDGTIKVHLKASSADDSANRALLKFLSEILDVPEKNFEVVADSGNDKLVSVLDIDAQEAHQKILENLA